INVAMQRLNEGGGEEIVEKQRVWMARRKELRDEQRELVAEVWAECARVWGR
ncbi:MAG: hypothetical protein L6R41_006681, partial [Letrouitia leprolyta]